MFPVGLRVVLLVEVGQLAGLVLVEPHFVEALLDGEPAAAEERVTVVVVVLTVVAQPARPHRLGKRVAVDRFEIVDLLRGRRRREEAGADQPRHDSEQPVPMGSRVGARRIIDGEPGGSCGDVIVPPVRRSVGRRWVDFATSRTILPVQPQTAASGEFGGVATEAFHLVDGEDDAAVRGVGLDGAVAVSGMTVAESAVRVVSRCRCRCRRAGAWRGRAVWGSGAVRAAGGRVRRGSRRASGTGGGATRAGRCRRSPR